MIMDATMNKVNTECSNYYSSSSSSPSSTSSPSDNSSFHAQATAPATISHKRKAGRKKFQETRHPVYRGVRHRNGDRWVCEVREPNKKSRIWLGTYSTPEMAARAHDVAVLALKGTSAVFNFPDKVSLLPVAKSSSAADIRVALAKISEVSAPTKNPSSSSTNDSMVEIETETNTCSVEGAVDFAKTMNNDDGSDKSVFFDEEAIYNMPVLLDSMAEGLLITPPSMKRFDWDEVDCETDLTLWTY